MHFCYLDETGCSGGNLDDDQEPIFVLGGIAVKDQGWSTTTNAFRSLLCDYLGMSSLPDNFELHSHELLSPKGEGQFIGHSRTRRNKLAFDLLDLVAERSHQVHYIALEKACIDFHADATESGVFSTKEPYLLGFNYMVTYLEAFVRNHLGRTARGMIIVDVKDQYIKGIEQITHYREFDVPKSRRLKWVVEFTYPVDSARHPMIQLTDLVVFCVRKFFEMDRGHRPTWSKDAKEFYAACFERIYERIWRKRLVKQGGPEGKPINALLQECYLLPSSGWKAKYGL